MKRDIIGESASLVERELRKSTEDRVTIKIHWRKTFLNTPTGTSGLNDKNIEKEW